MDEQRGTSRLAHGLNAALGRLPRSEFAIRKLMNNSEEFRELCADLAEAEMALANVSGLSEDVREARALEWRDLVDRLVAEIRTAVRGSEVWARRPEQ